MIRKPHHHGENRLERADLFLRATTIPVKELAFNLGWTNWKSFSNAIKHRFGEHPTPWRKQNRIRANQHISTRNIDLTVNGKGVVGSSLLRKDGVSHDEMVHGWRIKKLLMWDINGNPYIYYVSTQDLSKVRTRYVEGNGRELKRNVFIRLIEGSEVILPVIYDNYRQPVKGLSWYLELEVNVRQYPL